MTSITAAGTKVKFIERIANLLKDIDTFRETNSPNWKPEYDLIYDELTEIQCIVQGNMEEAEERFKNLPVAKYSSFREYVINTDVNVLRTESGTTQRFKSSRAKRKNNAICPQCGDTMVVDDSQFKCNNCNYTSEIKVNSTGSINGEDSKHSNKLIHTIAGIGKPPGSIQKIMDYAVIWLTQLRYVKEWLEAHRDRYANFIKVYRRVFKKPFPPNFFDKHIERSVEYVWEIAAYNLLMGEFQQMLEEAKAVSSITSNIWYLKNDEVYVIIERWTKENGTAIPPLDAKDEEGHEIGAYFAQLSLYPIVPPEHVKNKLEIMFGRSLSMAGLPFNFCEVFKRSEAVVRPYDLLQGNSWVQRYTFNVPPASITESELNNILEIMLQFNTFYKEYWLKRQSKTRNSPLYAVVLDMILYLPAFTRYRDELMMFVQKKEPKTREQIASTWYQFIQSKNSPVAKYVRPPEAPKQAQQAQQASIDNIFDE